MGVAPAHSGPNTDHKLTSSSGDQQQALIGTINNNIPSPYNAKKKNSDASPGYNNHPKIVGFGRHDTTGDGFGDLVGFGRSGVWVAVNNSNGNSASAFQAGTLVIPDFGSDQGWRCDRHLRLMLDLTGDGRADILGFGGAGVLVSKNNGDGTFGPAELASNHFGYNTSGGGWKVDTHPRILFDANGDGLPDIYGFGHPGVYLSINNLTVDSTFKSPTLVVEDFGYTSGWRVDRHPRFVVDLTGNGTGDIVGFGDAGIFVSLNDGNGNFSPVTRVVDDFAYKAGGWRVEKHLRFLADTTGDGRPDIVGFGTGGVLTSINNGDGTFASTRGRMVLADFGYNQGWRVDEHPRFLADLTGDGRVDIIGIKDDGIYVSLNNGSGRFGPVRK
ncbi:hypothetical protein FRC17_003103, partial [Serendipita sp. 399]